jgi:hypothetical protein
MTFNKRHHVETSYHFEAISILVAENVFVFASMIRASCYARAYGFYNHACVVIAVELY